MEMVNGTGKQVHENEEDKLGAQMRCNKQDCSEGGRSIVRGEIKQIHGTYECKVQRN